MKQTISLKVDSELIRPLRKAVNEFIQVLISSFTIRQEEKGLTLEVEFDFESQAVWLKEGKNHIRHQLDPQLIKQYQNELEDIMLGHEKMDWKHDNPAFPFRFGNGGTLPVIRYDDQDYYCFFYRDIAPIGWNIANGGAESFSELLDPLATIERELREELIIVNPIDKCWYIFDWIEGQRPDHPDFAISRRVWNEIFKRHDFKKLENRALPLKWLSGNDSVIIKFQNGDTSNCVTIPDCILNINAEDFGIEVDRVAKMSVGPGAILCDGELSNGKLLNQVVGLFEVNKFNKAMAAGKKEYAPDKFFWNGQDRSHDTLKTVINEYLDYVTKNSIRTLETYQEWENMNCKFGLCPVTRNLIRRYLLMEDEEFHNNNKSISDKSEKRQVQHNVFLSFPSEDLKLAQKVFSFLEKSGHKVFFSDETLHHPNFADEIDDALTGAKSMVLIGTRTELFFKNWVRYEWRTFHNDILSGRKPWKTPFITFTKTPDINSLPRPLANNQIIDFSKKTWGASLKELNDMLKSKKSDEFPGK